MMANTVDRHFSEEVVFTPKALSGNLHVAPSVDDRSEQPLVGVLRIKSEQTDTGGTRRNFRSEIGSDDAQFAIDRTIIPADLKFVKGDRITCSGRPSEPVFEIRSVDYGNINRVYLNLTAIS